MIWMKLAWRNLWRNRRRTLIELASIAGAVFLVITVYNLEAGSWEKMIDEGTVVGSGHIGLYNPSYLEERQITWGFSSTNLLEQLDADPLVAGAYPRVYLPGLARSSRESRPAALMGVDFTREAQVNPLLAEARFTEGALPDPDDPAHLHSAVVGSSLAAELRLEVGRRFVFMAQDQEGELQRIPLRIAGIIQTGSREIDAGTLLVSRQALTLFLAEPDIVHEIAVMLNGGSKRIPDVLDRIHGWTDARPDVAPYPWYEAMPELQETMQLDIAGTLVVIGLLYVLVGIGTVNTLLMSVMERTREFGIIRALGVRKRGVRRVVLAEAVVLAAVGSAVGLVIACLLGLYTSTVGIDLSGTMDAQEMGGIIFEPVLYSTFEIKGMLALTASMFLVAVLAALYPARRALKILPADAMRHY